MPSKYRAGYVYLLNARDTSKYKIGLTIDLDRRLKELNSGQAPDPVDCIYSIRVSDMGVVENALHQRFSAYHHHGEWFIFELRDLDLVRAEYDRLRSQYPYRTEKPRKKSSKEQGHIELKKYMSHPPINTNRMFPALIFWLILIASGLFSVLTIPKANLEVAEKNMRVKISASPKYKGANLRTSPNGKLIDQYIPNGEIVEIISKKDGWCQSDVGWFDCNLGQ